MHRSPFKWSKGLSTIYLFMLAGLCCFVTSANSQRVLALHPLFTEQNALVIPQLASDWVLTDFDFPVSIRRTGDNFYTMTYKDDHETSVFEAVFRKVGSNLFLDLKGVLPQAIHDEDYKQSFLPAHSLNRVRMLHDTLELSQLNYSWVYRYVKQNKGGLTYEWLDHCMLLTSSAQDLENFLLEHQSDEQLFSLYASMTPVKKTVDETVTTNREYTRPYAIEDTIIQRCEPVFPFQHGWLGADGDVSVAISPTTTLFFFSDTYVGTKNQVSRKAPGMKMVSNSVAVETCTPHGTDVRYYWNEMFKEHPQPMFDSYTDRYRFWLNDAFVVNKNLYVLLEKIGSKQGAAPDDLFNFSLLGFTLAKISNYTEPPDTWQVELKALPVVKNPEMGIRCCVPFDGYVYFFVSRDHDKIQSLLRKKMDGFDEREQAFEYYALNKTWKTGINPTDMDTLITGFRCNTVHYHADVKKWVMVCDIPFLGNHISIRTSSSLTGPWSNEQPVYEIPEVTPGTASYQKSNFCYLARECIQNYDSNTHELLIT